MYLFYVDESGDVGLGNSPTRYFVLTAFIVHELRWRDTLDAIITFRKDLRTQYGLKLREEIHAGNFLHGPKKLARISKSVRLKILRDVLNFEATLPDISIVNIVVDKQGKTIPYDVFENAWQTLIQRLHNTISHRNFPGPQNAQDLGLLLIDPTDEKKLRNLTRRMRHYNPVPHMQAAGYSGGYRQILITTLAEDPSHRDSLHSYFIQLCDVNAFFLQQKLKSCRYIKKKGGVNYFDRLNPVLCTVASRSNPQGIVYI